MCCRLACNLCLPPVDRDPAPIEKAGVAAKADAAAVPVPGLPKFDAGVLVVPKEKFAVGVLCPNPGAVVPVPKFKLGVPKLNPPKVDLFSTVFAAPKLNCEVLWFCVPWLVNEDPNIF